MAEEKQRGVSMGAVPSQSLTETRAERARESNERFRAGFEQGAVGQALSSLDGRFLRVNEAFARMLGYPAAELERKTLAEVTHPGDRGAGADAMGPRVGGGETFRFERRYRARNGGRQQDRAARALERRHDVPEPAARLRVEAGRRLVEEEDRRVGHERAGDREALLLAAGEVLAAGALLLAQGYEIEHFVDRLAASVEGAEERERLAHRELGLEVRLLERDAEPLAQPRRVLLPAATEQGDLARRRLEQPLEDLDRRGLAGAVRPEQAEALPAYHLEVEPVDRDDVAEALHEPAARDGRVHAACTLLRLQAGAPRPPVGPALACPACRVGMQRRTGRGPGGAPALARRPPASV
ncbi:MAG: PAS domain S-box protein [Myxococcales bacterium]|nr:PAS domain S-box protein [Myxococcales bacterium]